MKMFSLVTSNADGLLITSLHETEKAAREEAIVSLNLYAKRNSIGLDQIQLALADEQVWTDGVVKAQIDEFDLGKYVREAKKNARKCGSRAKKTVKKPMVLNAGKGLACELAKGEYIGQDEDGGFIIVDDICDAYLGVDGEFDDEIDNWKSDGMIQKGYPRMHTVSKSVTVHGTKVLKVED